MSAIYKRDFMSYFNSPIGYAVLAAFMFFNGIFFYVQCLYPGTTNMSSVFQSMFFIVLFVIPLITMKTFSDDKRNKTDQALLTSPVSVPAIVTAKFLSALSVFALCLVSFLIDGIAISFMAQTDWSVLIGNIFGMLILGSAFISLGILISSMTESYIVAAVVPFAVNVLLSLLDMIGYSVNVDWLTAILNAISFQSKYNNIALGIVSLSDIVFFITVTCLFLFLTDRVIERRRWA